MKTLLLALLLFAVSIAYTQEGTYYCAERHQMLTIYKTGTFELSSTWAGVYSWTLPDGLRHGVRTESGTWGWNATRDTVILYLQYYDSVAYEHVFTATAVYDGPNLNIGFYWVRDAIPPHWMQYYVRQSIGIIAPPAY